ncbi:hypothetical protein C5609_17755 [Pseudomonas putida]|uniref:GNAT family N-acetyltransferase n=1 Tax=Pseudomonas putida TaxID=303 RepID=UPI00106FC37F|nr:hypothetical protein C5609_17755 [Pseudomonas putida]
MDIRKPELSAHEDDWKEYAKAGCELIKSKLALFLTKRLGGKRKRQEIALNTGGGRIVRALGANYDLYLRLFPRTETGWPRETIVIAGVRFDEQRKGHGTELLKLLVKLAPVVGYQHIGIETTNHRSAPFAERCGLQFTGRGSDYIGSVADIQQALR